MDSLLPAITGGIGALTGALGGAVSVYIGLRKDTRETRAQVISESAETIRLLEKQNLLMETQLKTANDRERKLEDRVSKIEDSYRELVIQVTNMGLCANAPSCHNYNPGDRRNK